MTPPPRTRPGRCLTCGDLAVVLTVAALDGDGVAICETPGGAPETVDVSLIEPPRVGDRVLVHAGVALAHLGDRAGR